MVVTDGIVRPAGWAQPIDWAKRCAIRDDNLAHQIRIIGHTKLWVTCRCRLAAGHPIAEIVDAEGAIAAYKAYHLEINEDLRYQPSEPDV